MPARFARCAVAHRPFFPVATSRSPGPPGAPARKRLTRPHRRCCAQAVPMRPRRFRADRRRGPSMSTATIKPNRQVSPSIAVKITSSTHGLRRSICQAAWRRQLPSAGNCHSMPLYAVKKIDASGAYDTGARNDPAGFRSLARKRQPDKTNVAPRPRTQDARPKTQVSYAKPNEMPNSNDFNSLDRLRYQPGFPPSNGHQLISHSLPRRGLACPAAPAFQSPPPLHTMDVPRSYEESATHA